jgi:putative ABC transport system permease protein
VLGVAVARHDLGLAGGVPRAGDIQFDAATMAISAVLALVVGALTGLISAWRYAARPDLESLRGEMASATAGFDLLRRHRLQGMLIVAQVALAWTLLAGGGLLLRSYANLSGTSPGYDPAQVLTFQLRSRGARPASPLLDPRDVPRMLAEYDRVAERIGALPGVIAVGYSQSLPMTRTLSVVLLRMTPDPPRRAPGGSAPGSPDFGTRLPPDQPNVRAVSVGFMDALGMRLVAGRNLQDTDDALAPKAMLINRTLADSGFLWNDPIGRQIYAVGRQPWTIVGIVEDVRRFGLDQEPDPQIFVDLRQAPELLFGGPPMNFAVRTTGAPATSTPAILKAIRQRDPETTMDRVATTGQLLSAALARSRLYASLLAAFATVALALSALGVYAVLTYAVSQRTRELGVRRALGATHRDLATLVLGQVLTLILVGLALGMLLATAGTRALESLLFGIQPLDTATFVAAGFAFSAVAVVAVLAPLKRAMRVDPMLTLRAT